MNKSRAHWRAMAIKIPLQIDDLDKIPQISNDIKSMLRSHAKVFLGREAPYCFLSQIESSFAELSLGCNLKSMVKCPLLASCFIYSKHNNLLHYWNNIIIKLTNYVIELHHFFFFIS